ncbi:hypothetical protein HDN1F_00250 [gamma proteobacterium HdN1]|nr:hypothetical protein HDN1F_00250 [gamma proteobacterium HdN1]
MSQTATLPPEVPMATERATAIPTQPHSSSPSDTETSALDTQREHTPSPSESLNTDKPSLDNASTTLRERNERFGRDINSRIDLLETHIGQTTSLVERSQTFVRNALDELRERMTQALHEIEKRITQQQNENEASRQKLEQSQTALKKDLTDLTDEHNATIAQVEAVAEQAYSAHQRINQQHRYTQTQIVQLGIAATAGIGLCLLLIGYFVYNPVAAPEEIKGKLQILSADAQLQKNQTTQIGNQLAQMEAQQTSTDATLTGLQSEVGGLKSNETVLLDRHQGQQNEISKLRSEINRLEQNLTQLQRTTTQQRAVAQRTTATASNTISTRPPAAQIPALLFRDGHWLNSRPSQHYVIQLASSGSRANLTQFAGSHAAILRTQPLTLTTSRRNAQTWHHLYYGDYPNELSARTALSHLPASLRQNQPWVRQIASLAR